MISPEDINKRFLLQEEYLGVNKAVNNFNPLVSIYVTTYQHVKYIAECLDGILMQKVNFNYEVIVGEDQSADGTREICIEYAKKHPDKIRLYLRDRNLTVIKDKAGNFVKSLNGIFVLMAARGKYVALCEGDDYWTDPGKLQKQVDFLESNPDFSICFHEIKVLQDGKLTDDFITKVPAEVTAISDISTGNFIHTPSVVFRRALIDPLPRWYFKSLVGDRILYMLLTKDGHKIKYLHEPMGVYRITSTGQYSMKSQETKLEYWMRELHLTKDKFSDEINALITERYKRHILHFIGVLINQKRIKEGENYLFELDNVFLLRHFKTVIVLKLGIMNKIKILVRLRRNAFNVTHQLLAMLKHKLLR